MKDPKVGEVIAVYADGIRIVTVVTGIIPNGNIQTAHFIDSIHPKQCRRLKPKKNKTWWIVVNKNGSAEYALNNPLSDIMLNDGERCIEVKEKKK